MVSKMEISNDLKVICPSRKQYIVHSKTELHIEMQHAEFLKDLVWFHYYFYLHKRFTPTSMIVKLIMFADDTNLFYNETS